MCLRCGSVEFGEIDFSNGASALQGSGGEGIVTEEELNDQETCDSDHQVLPSALLVSQSRLLILPPVGPEHIREELLAFLTEEPLGNKSVCVFEDDRVLCGKRLKSSEHLPFLHLEPRRVGLDDEVLLRLLICLSSASILI
jgi:hypothetical protein